MQVDQLTQVFSQGGVLSQKYDKYEFRQGQLNMAKVVEKVVADKGVGIIEGATGVGKSFAYLIPIILSGKKAIISTSNKSLQDQLYKKDLPFLKKTFPGSWDFTILKGRQNYFSFMFFEINQLELKELISKEELAQIKAWADEQLETEGEGDLEYYPGDLSRRVKDLICAQTYVKPLEQSHYTTVDFASKARTRAKSAQIVLVNHTLLAIDCALRMQTEGKASILPVPSVYIIDEAHTFEHYALLAFSEKLNYFSLGAFLNNRTVKKICGKPATKKILNEFKQTAHLTYLPEKNRGYYRDTEYDKFDLCGYADKIDKCIRELKSSAEGADEASAAKLAVIIKSGEHLRTRLKEISKNNKEEVRWVSAIERRNYTTVSFNAAPLSIAHFLQAGLFKKSVGVIFTSATLAVNGTFSHLKLNLGIPINALEYIAKSPFNYKQNALLFVPKQEEDEFEVARELIDAAKGGAFFLFTSYKAMNKYYQKLDIPYPKLVQEYGVSRQKLLEQFRQTKNGVLFGTKSFWEGVDVADNKLRLVIIHKLPFKNPSDLLYATKIKRIDEAAGKKFAHWMSYTLPCMCIDLKQGVGRLIRSKTDYGVMAILDKRLNTARYKGIVLKSLPDTYVTQRLEAVREFYISRS